MSKNAGYIVKTKTEKIGRTYHRDGLINKKMIVYINVDNKIVKMLCDPKSTPITGFIN